MNKPRTDFKLAVFSAAHHKREVRKQWLKDFILRYGFRASEELSRLLQNRFSITYKSADSLVGEVLDELSQVKH